MSKDGRTLPPPGRRATLEPPKPWPAPPPLRKPAAEPPELPVAAPRARLDTLRGVSDDERLDRPEAEVALRAAEERERQLLAQLQAAQAARRPQATKLPLPPVEVEEEQPTGSSTPSVAPKTDQALGKLVRYLLKRFGFQGLLALGIGGVALKPAAAPQKVDAATSELAGLRREHDVDHAALMGMLTREAQTDAYTRCLEDTLNEVGEQLLPAQDKMGSASPPRAYVKRCARLRP